MILAPDELQADLYVDELRDNLKEGVALAFAHGLSVHFRLIEPRPDLDVFMVVPKAPAIPSGPSLSVAAACAPDCRCTGCIGNALEIGLSYASAIGGRSGIIETTFREECETDLFGEQPYCAAA